MDLPPPIVLEYAQDHEYQRLHLWLPEKIGSGPIPLVVFLSGGGWSGPQTLPTVPTAGAEFLARGFAWAQAGYAWSNMPGPLNPATFPVPEDDARKIVSFFRDGGHGRVGLDFVALDGRSAGSFACIWAATQPNAVGRITRPNAIMVAQLAGHWYPALVQSVGSDMAKHIAWPTAQLQNVPMSIQVAASPYTWIANRPPLVPAHITGAQEPTAISGWANPTTVAGLVPIGHDGWNALALHQQLLRTNPAHVAHGVYIDGTPPADAAAHRAAWLRRHYDVGNL